MIALLRTLILNEERQSNISIFVNFAWSTRSLFVKSLALAIDSAKHSFAKGSAMSQADAIPHKAIYVVQNTHDAARDSCEVSSMSLNPLVLLAQYVMAPSKSHIQHLAYTPRLDLTSR